MRSGATFLARVPGRAKNLARVPFSVARDNSRAQLKNLAEDRRDQPVVSFIGCYATFDNC